MAQGGIFGALQSAAAGFKEGASASIHRLVPIDVEKTVRKLGLQEKASANGKANLPVTESTDLDSSEQAIVDEVEGYVEDFYQDYLVQTQTLSNRVAEREYQDTATLLETEARTAVVELEKMASSGSNNLHVLRQSAVAREEELKRFKTEHRLERPAMRFDANKIFHYGILLILLVTEAVMNGVFLAKGNEMGLVGGVIQALVIALINVLFAYIVGKHLIPYLRYRYIMRRLGAWLLFFVYLAWVFVFNLGVAHYRDAIQSDPFVAAFKAWQTLQAAPFDLKDIESVMMIAVGLLFSLIAVIDVFKMDDPYPGYGEVHRAWVDAAEIYNETHEEQLEALREFMEETKTKLTDLANQVRAEQNDRLAAMNSLTTHRSAMMSFIADCERAANLLLKVYRDANRAARTSPAPARYSDGSSRTMRPRNLDAHSTGDMNIDAVKARVEKVNDAHREWNGKVIDAYAAAFRSVDSIGVILIPAIALNKSRARLAGV